MRCNFIKPQFYIYCTLISFCLISLNACKWLGEESYQSEVIKVNTNKQDCFKDFPELIRSYLESDTKKSELDDFFVCTRNSVDDFMRRTVEQNPKKGFSKKEIKSLIETFMLQDNDGKIFAERFLVLKRAFVGGDPNHITRKEWERLKVLWPAFKKTIVSTKDLTSAYYFFNKDPDYFKVIEKRQKNFLKAFKSFFEKLNATGGRLNEEEILFLKNQILSFEKLKKFKEVFDGLFSVYLNFPTTNEESWTHAFEFLEKALRVNAYIRRANLEENIFAPSSTLYYALVLKSVINALDYAQKLNWQNPIAQSELEKIVLGLHDSGVLFKNVKKSSDFSMVFSKIGKNLFSNQYEEEWVLSEQDLQFLRYKFNVWIASLIDVLKQYENLSLEREYEGLLFDETGYERDYKIAADEIYNKIVLKSHILNPSKGKFTFKVTYAKNPRTSRREQKRNILSYFYQTTMANMTVLFFDTYGKQKNLEGEQNKVITENTVDRMYSDIRPITMAEGLNNPLICSAGTRSFLEANLFSYSGNGDDKVDVYEGLQWLTSAISASTTATAIFNDAIADGCKIPGNAKFQNLPYLDPQCFKSSFKANYKKHLYHIPGLLVFLRENQNFDKFYEQYFSMIRTCKNSKLPISFDEVQYAVALLQYIEALFDVFDKENTSYFVFNRDKNKVLDSDELWSAYNQRFHGIIRRLGEQQTGKKLSKRIVNHIYRRLIVNKTMPVAPNGTWDKITWFLGGRSFGGMDPYNRLDIYEIFDSVLTHINNYGSVVGNYCQALSLSWEEYRLNGVFSIEEYKNTCKREDQ